MIMRLPEMPIFSARALSVASGVSSTKPEFPTSF
jgi:hypothetical protein